MELTVQEAGPIQAGEEHEGALPLLDYAQAWDRLSYYSRIFVMDLTRA